MEQPDQNVTPSGEDPERSRSSSAHVVDDRALTVLRELSETRLALLAALEQTGSGLRATIYAYRSVERLPLEHGSDGSLSVSDGGNRRRR